MPFEKRKHHYVPQFWIRGFTDARGKLFGRIGGKVKEVSSSRVMQENWLYTIFDSHWNPSDSLEDALSVDETAGASLFARIGVGSTGTTAVDRDELCWILALQACRHPDIMHMGRRRANVLGELIANVKSLDSSTFINQIACFGIPSLSALQIYLYMREKSPEELANEVDELTRLSPQDYRLPEQDALRAVPIVCMRLKEMEFTLIDAPSGREFVLGDTPLPQEHLTRQFSVPVSKSLAVIAIPATSRQTIMARRAASNAEVDTINKIQCDNSLRVVVGSNRAVLSAL